jgi:ribosomal protein S18 acetylase RimI-like enzyme
MVSIIEKKYPQNVIFDYLKENAYIFVPKLDTKVDLNLYSSKLSELAHQFWAIEQNEIIGFLACYFNDPLCSFGYISTFSVVKSHQGRGIGQLLLEKAISYGKINSFRIIGLEVNMHNHRAINFYVKNGFKSTKETNDSILMEKSLN